LEDLPHTFKPADRLYIQRVNQGVKLLSAWPLHFISVLNEDSRFARFELRGLRPEIIKAVGEEHGDGLACVLAFLYRLNLDFGFPPLRIMLAHGTALGKFGRTGLEDLADQDQFSAVHAPRQVFI